MKSNLSQKEINAGMQTIDLLTKNNILLSPHTLKKVIPSYKKFIPNINQYGLWFNQKFTKKIDKYDKIFFLLNGLAASGKDSIYHEMVNLTPKLFYKTVTATSRTARKSEIDKIDYHFYTNVSKFKSDIKKNKFIEFLDRNGVYYGLPKISIDNAFKQPNPIIYCQIEMSGWEKLEKYLFSLKKKTLIIKAFILPHMNINHYLKWLEQNRIGEDTNSRINKSGWELTAAPKKADFIISNRINPKIPTLIYSAKSIINYLLQFFKNPSINKFSLPTDDLKNTNNPSNIIKTHDSIS